MLIKIVLIATGFTLVALFLALGFAIGAGYIQSKVLDYIQDHPSAPLVKMADTLFKNLKNEDSDRV